MFWRIDPFPTCTHHVFLSHSREDHDGLVRPVFESLQTSGIISWLDREDYYYGRDSRTALRDAVLRSRHIVFFITGAMLENARGWCAFELAYAEILQLALQVPGGPLLNVSLPLFLVPQSDDRLPRSVWQLARDRGRFFDPAASQDAVGWCRDEIFTFLTREESLAKDHSKYSRQDPKFFAKLNETPGLCNRVIRFKPKRVAIADRT